MNKRIVAYLLAVGFLTLTPPPLSLADTKDTTPQVTKKSGGLDPTRKKFFARTEYRELENDGKLSLLDVLYEFPLGKKWFLRNSTSLKRTSSPGLQSKDGLGDLTTRLTYLALSTEANNRLLVGLEAVWDTATASALGGNRNTLSPVITGYVRFPELKVVSFPSIQFVDTYSRESGAADTKTTTIKPSIVKIHADGYYTFFDPAFIWDHEKNDQSTGTFDVEYGRFVNDKMYYVRPGTTLWGNDTPFSFKWNLEVGIRIFL